MPIDIEFSSIDTDYEKREYEKLVHWVHGFCMNLKIKMPKIKVDKKYIQI